MTVTELIHSVAVVIRRRTDIKTREVTLSTGTIDILSTIGVRRIHKNTVNEILFISFASQ